MSSCPAESQTSVSISPAARTAARCTAGLPREAAWSQRRIRIGLLGLGNIGQAVARLVASAAGAHAGVHFHIECALVRDPSRARACDRPPCITNNVSAFLHGRYDLVIEAMGGIEPALTIVTQLLERGIPVVTANKTLIATAGQELQALAVARGTTLRYEASAIAGVPFLGTLAARPLVSSIDRFTAVLNGTSNFILTALEEHGGTFAHALALAQQRGLTEPDPARDLDGDDAADKLALLTSVFGWGRVDRASLEGRSLRDVSSRDVRAARALGGALKPVALASRAAGGVEAFIGPTWVPAHTPLAALGGTLNGIELHGRYVGDLFFSGPGAGPDVTAATLLDDAIEAVREGDRSGGSGFDFAQAKKDPPPHPVSQLPSRPREPLRITAPITPWFIRVEFPGVVPTVGVLTDVFGRAGMTIEHVTDAIDGTRYVLAGPARRERMDAAIHDVWRVHRLRCVAFRRLG